MLLTKASSLFAACHGLYPFVDPELLEETDDGIQPISGARTWEIDEVLQLLHEQDERDGGHAIDTIMSRVFMYVGSIGFGTAIDKEELSEGDYETVGVFADVLRLSSFRMEG